MNQVLAAQCAAKTRFFTLAGDTRQRKKAADAAGARSELTQLRSVIPVRSLRRWEYWEKAQVSSCEVLQCMWHRLKNLFISLETYGDLSPDLRVRKQVNQMLRDRSALPLQEWFQTFYEPHGISKATVTFAYKYLAQYSGLDIARVLPSDRLDEDLHWTQVCWFDWQEALCQDFLDCFNIDLHDSLDSFTPDTVEDLIVFLDYYGRGSTACSTPDLE